MPGILNVLLDLAFLPARCRVAEFGLEQTVARYGQEAGTDLPFAAWADPVHGGAHVVVDAAPRHATQHAKAVVVGVEQHLVRLQEVGPHRERPTVAELEVGDLQLGALAADDGVLLAPVELKRLARREGQWHEDAAARGLLPPLPVFPPGADEGGDAPVRTVIAEPGQFRVELPGRAFLFARPAGIRPKPSCQSLGEGIELAGAIRRPENRLHRLGPQVLADGVPQQASPTGDRPDRQVFPEMPTPDNAQQGHVQHSCPRPKGRG